MFWNGCHFRFLNNFPFKIMINICFIAIGLYHICYSNSFTIWLSHKSNRKAWTYDWDFSAMWRLEFQTQNIRFEFNDFVLNYNVVTDKFTVRTYQQHTQESIPNVMTETDKELDKKTYVEQGTDKLILTK